MLKLCPKYKLQRGEHIRNLTPLAMMLFDITHIQRTACKNNILFVMLKKSL